MTTQTQTIADFLLARIAEDEEAACDAHAWISRWPAHAPYSIGNVSPDLPRNRFRIAPTRMLAECEAKRRIVQEHAEHVDGGRCRTCNDHDDAMVNQAYPCTTLLALAQPYADHPDFRGEWRL